MEKKELKENFCKHYHFNCLSCPYAYKDYTGVWCRVQGKFSMKYNKETGLEKL